MTKLIEILKKKEETNKIKLLIKEKNEFINYNNFLIKKNNKLYKSRFYFNNLTKLIDNIKLNN